MHTCIGNHLPCMHKFNMHFYFYCNSQAHKQDFGGGGCHLEFGPFRFPKFSVKQKKQQHFGYIIIQIHNKYVVYKTFKIF